MKREKSKLPGLRPPGKLDEEEIEKMLEERRAEQCVPYVIRQISDRMTKHKLPLPVIVHGELWMATNLWEVVSSTIPNDNTFSLLVRMLWLSITGESSSNPLGETGRLPGFGPGFKLPYDLSLDIKLTAMPTTQGGWSTGIAPGVPKEHYGMVHKALKRELKKLPWFGGSKTGTYLGDNDQEGREELNDDLSD
jgi:hypothetical protein